MTLIESIQEITSLNALKDILKGLFKDYDSLVDEYKDEIYQSGMDLSLDNSPKDDSYVGHLHNKDKIMTKLKDLVAILNKIQVIFEELNYKTDSSVSNDVSEGNFLNQLDQFSKQAYNLIEDFNRESFPAFYNNLSYLSSLSEIHYNGKFEHLQENIEISDKVEETLEETEEYLESLPEIKTNEVK